MTISLMLLDDQEVTSWSETCESECFLTKEPTMYKNSQDSKLTIFANNEMLSNEAKETPETQKKLVKRIGIFHHILGHVRD